MNLPNRRPLRVAFSNICTKQWIAGCHYLKNLFIALRSIEDKPDLVLYGDSADNSHSILTEHIDQLLSSPLQNLWPLRQTFRLERRFGIPLGLSRYEASFLHKHSVDVIFTQLDLGQQFNLPLLAWLTDFQHLHLPKMFSPNELKQRDRAYQRTAQRANRVILSSQSALKDFQKFTPELAAKGKVINFTAHIPASVYDLEPAKVCKLYQLPERFFYLPNQFWKHKNHQVVVEALALPEMKNTGITVVCSGRPNDSRNPEYFPELQTRIKKLGIQENLIILGMIPQDHIFQLMRQTQAILQPSLFEGWSTSVEEAKSIGKQIILSDLEVHREQDPPKAVFFDPQDPHKLADCLIRTSNSAPPGPDLALEEQARKHLQERIRAFGEAFMTVVRETLSA